MTSQYVSLLEKKRFWTPIAFTAGETLSGGEATLEKALALSCLEMDVKSFLIDAADKDLPDTIGVREILLSNAEDEDRHDLALRYAKAAHPVAAETEAEAAKIQKAWEQLDLHPIVKAAFLERSVFFVILPIYRFLGDIGLRTTAADISRDETIHTASHSMVAHDIGAGPSRQLNALRRATVDWLVSDLNTDENRFLSKDFWLKQSDDLFSRGIAPDLVETRRSRMPAFFEAPNTSLPSYA